jgi:hypothetical protein
MVTDPVPQGKAAAPAGCENGHEGCNFSVGMAAFRVVAR